MLYYIYHTEVAEEYIDHDNFIFYVRDKIPRLIIMRVIATWRLSIKGMITDTLELGDYLYVNHKITKKF